MGEELLKKLFPFWWELRNNVLTGEVCTAQLWLIMLLL